MAAGLHPTGPIQTLPWMAQYQLVPAVVVYTHSDPRERTWLHFRVMPIFENGRNVLGFPQHTKNEAQWNYLLWICRRMELLNTSVENSTAGNETATDDDTSLQFVQLATYQVAMAIAKYWYKFLVPIGVIGNTLSFLVMMKPSNRKLSTCIYMASISVNDNIMMFVGMYSHVTNDMNVHQIGKIECKFIAFLALMSLQNTTYQVLAMTTDKFIAIKWPHKAATYSTPRRAKISLLCVHIFVIVYNIPHLFLSDTQAKICRVYLKPGLFSAIHTWLSFVVNFIIPFSLLFFMNFIIIQQVKRSHQEFGNMSKSNEEQSDKTPAQQRVRTQKSVENQLTRMLVLVTSLFLILLFPTNMRFIYTTLVTPNTPEKQAESILIYHISSKLYVTNSGVNFFLYCISGQKFRSDSKELLCCCKGKEPRRKPSEFSGTTLSSVEGESSTTTATNTTRDGVWWVRNVSSRGTYLLVWRLIHAVVLTPFWKITSEQDDFVDQSCQQIKLWPVKCQI